MRCDRIASGGREPSVVHIASRPDTLWTIAASPAERKMPRVTSRQIWSLGFLGLLSFAGEPLQWTRLLFLLFLAPLVEDGIGWIRRKRSDDPSAPAALDLPLPGPARRGGPMPFLLRCWLSDLLTLLHPRGLRQVLAQARGESAARRRIGDTLPTVETYRQRVEYTLPFIGTWLVARGGTTPETSHSRDILSQRYAYDFLVVDDSGQRHRDDGSTVQDYHAYGQPILAPADGEVVEVIDGVRDATRVGTGWIDWGAPHIGGNSVTIRHAPDEFSHLAHLVPGSIRVRPGQRVRRGEVVGACGNSGHSTEPHLHFQIQDHPDFFQAVGLPVKFSEVVIQSDAQPRTGHLMVGDHIRNGSAATAPMAGELPEQAQVGEDRDKGRHR